MPPSCSGQTGTSTYLSLSFSISLSLFFGLRPCQRQGIPRKQALINTGSLETGGRGSGNSDKFFLSCFVPMSCILHNDPSPEAMTPPHAIRQGQASPALDAPLNSKPFGFAVKSPTWEAFSYAKAAVQTVDHSFNQRVTNPLWNLPKPDLIPFADPLPFHRGQMLGVNPIIVPNLIQDGTGREPMLNCPHHFLSFQPMPMGKTMPKEFSLAGFEPLLLMDLFDQPAVEKQLLNLAVILLTFFWIVLLPVFLSLGI